MTEIINQLPLPSDMQYKIFIYLLGLEGTSSCRVFKNALIEYQTKNKKANKIPKEFNIYKFLGINVCGRQLEINELNISSVIYEIRIAQFDSNEDNWTKGTIRTIRKYMWILQERFKIRHKMLYL
jgi:hypothetical protein